MNIYVHTRKINEYTTQYFALDELNNELFKNTFVNEYSDVIDFIACVHALMYLKKHDLYGDVYVYDKYIKQCVENKKYKKNAKSQKGVEALYKAKMWLSDRRNTIIIYLNN